jgi:hypothetical protein
MKTISKLLVLCLIGFAVNSFAQGGFSKIKLVTGDLSFLNGEKGINVQYDYSEMKIGGFDEEDYVNQKVEEKNKKEAGSGDKWKEAWESDKIAKYQYKFELLLNKYLAENNITVSEDSADTKYTLILKTTLLEPGYYVGISSKPAYINVEIVFVANDDKSTNLAKMVMTNVVGEGVDTGSRIGEAYAKCGKSLANYINKNVFGK